MKQDKKSSTNIFQEFLTNSLIVVVQPIILHYCTYKNDECYYMQGEVEKNEWEREIMKAHTLIYIFINSWKEFIQYFTYFPIYSSSLSKRVSKLINILGDLSWMIHSTSSRESKPKHPSHTLNLRSRSACSIWRLVCLTSRFAWISLRVLYHPSRSLIIL